MRKLLFAIVNASTAAITYEDEAAGTINFSAPTPPACAALLAARAPGVAAIQLYGEPNGHKIELQIDVATHNTVVFAEEDGTPSPPEDLGNALDEVDALIAAHE